MVAAFLDALLVDCARKILAMLAADTTSFEDIAFVRSLSPSINQLMLHPEVAIAFTWLDFDISKSFKSWLYFLYIICVSAYNSNIYAEVLLGLKGLFDIRGDVGTGLRMLRVALSKEETSVAPALAIFLAVKAANNASPFTFRSILEKAISNYEKVVMWRINIMDVESYFNTKEVFAAFLGGLMIEKKCFDAFGLLSNHVGRPECIAVGVCNIFPPHGMVEFGVPVEGMALREDNIVVNPSHLALMGPVEEGDSLLLGSKDNSSMVFNEASSLGGCLLEKKKRKNVTSEEDCVGNGRKLKQKVIEIYD